MTLRLRQIVWLTSLTMTVSLAVQAPVSALSRLKVDLGNPRHFVDTLNNPVLLVGDSPQNLPQKLTVAQMQTYFADCQSKGINLCWVCIDGQPTASPTGVPPVDRKGNLEFASGGTPNGWDLSLVNAAYFSQTIDSMLILAENNGIYVNFMPMSQCYWDPSTIDANSAQKALNYGVWLGNRYQNQRNILWLFGNDNIDTSRQCPLARGIVSTGDNHFMSVHALNAGVWGQDPNDNANGASGNFYKHLPNSTMTWITYNNLYSDMGVLNQAHFVHNEYLKTDIMPMLMSEGPYQPLAGYSWQIATNMVSRSLNYRVAMGGGFGGAYTYGCDWLNNGVNPWNADLNKGARPHIKFFSNLLKSRPWWNLKPDWGWTFITASSLGGASQETDNNYTIATFDTAHSAFGLVYCTAAQTVTMNLARLSGPVTARWYDPTNGNYSAISGSPFANSGSHQFTTPAAVHSDTNTDNSVQSSSDWVLVLETSGMSNIRNAEDSPAMKTAGVTENAANGFLAATDKRVLVLLKSAGSAGCADVYRIDGKCLGRNVSHVTLSRLDLPPIAFESSLPGKTALLNQQPHLG